MIYVRRWSEDDVGEGDMELTRLQPDVSNSSMRDERGFVSSMT